MKGEPKMRKLIPLLAVAAALPLASVAHPECTGRFCRPVDSWVSADSSGLALGSQLSTLDSSAHCRIHVGDDGSASNFVGSGTLIAKNESTGLILTCSHLFDNANSNIVVTFPNGTRFGARLIDRDPGNDLAALVIRTPDVEPLSVVDTDPVGVLTTCGYGGEGRFQSVRGTITGAAQAVGATFPSLKIGGAVRPGDSGGGVLNTAGQVVGVVWGCRDGETYLTCGTPLRNFLQRILPQGERASGSDERSRIARGETTPTLDPQTWRNEIESRLSALDAKKQDRGDYLQPGDLNAYAKQTDIKQIEESTTSHIESLRTALINLFEERVSTLNPGLFSGLSTGKVLAGALGLSGPVAIAVMIAGGLAGRRIKRHVAASPNSQPSTLHSQPFPVAVDSPPPPQQTIPESHYVPVERDNFARAHQWAREQVARKYPGATEVLTTLESLIKQQLAGNK
jgi:hypothetical protein